MKLVLSFALVLILSSFASSEDPTTCPKGFKQLARKCYSILYSSLNFFGAVTACDVAGGDVVEIVSQAEQELVAKYLTSRYVQYRGFWTGIVNLHYEGWRYISSKNKNSLKSWNSWAPGYHGGTIVSITPSSWCAFLASRSDWKWEFVKCSERMGVLCSLSLRDEA